MVMLIRRALQGKHYHMLSVKNYFVKLSCLQYITHNLEKPFLQATCMLSNLCNILSFLKCKEDFSQAQYLISVEILRVIPV